MKLRYVFEMLPASFTVVLQRFGEIRDGGKELFREMARLDAELQAMIEADPELEEIYAEEMGEVAGSVIYLPEAPTPEDWARAQELANRK
jgi:hypothetical protein